MSRVSRGVVSVSPGVAETRCWLQTTSGEWEPLLGRCERFFAPFLAVTMPWNSVCMAHAQGQSTQRRRRSVSREDKAADFVAQGDGDGRNSRGRLCIAGDYASLRARKWAKKWP